MKSALEKWLSPEEEGSNEEVEKVEAPDYINTQTEEKILV